LSIMLCCGGMAVIGMMVEREEDAGRELVDWPPVSLAFFATAIVVLVVAVPLAAVVYQRDRRRSNNPIDHERRRTTDADWAS
jgi:hypothetical protein